MKMRHWTFAFLAVLLLAIQSCGGEKPTPSIPKTPEQLAVEALATPSGTQTWTLTGGGTVTRDGVDVSSTYTGFELVLNSGSSKTYTSRNNNDLFDANGNWAFAGANFDKFTLTGIKPAANREISFTSSGNNLTLIFTIPTPGSRTSAVAGNYTFKLLKK
jgi:hypothetical protein